MFEHVFDGIESELDFQIEEVKQRLSHNLKSTIRDEKVENNEDIMDEKVEKESVQRNTLGIERSDSQNLNKESQDG